MIISFLFWISIFLAFLNGMILFKCQICLFVCFCADTKTYFAENICSSMPVSQYYIVCWALSLPSKRYYVGWMLNLKILSPTCVYFACSYLISFWCTEIILFHKIYIKFFAFFGDFYDKYHNFEEILSGFCVRTYTLVLLHENLISFEFTSSGMSTTVSF